MTKQAVTYCLDSRSDPDIFGLALLEQFSRQTSEPLYLERDDGYQVAFRIEEFLTDSFCALENQALSMCRGHVLDIGAGSGRHSLQLKRSVQVENITAVDCSRFAVEVMSRRGVEEIIHARWEDLLRSDFPEGIDTIILLNNSIGMVGSIEGLGTFLEKAFDWLQHGSSSTDVTKSIILDCSDPMKETDPEHLAYFKRRESLHCYRGSNVFRFRYKGIVGNWFDWLYVDPNTLAEVAHANGFSCTILGHDETTEYLAQLFISAKP